MSLQGIFDPMVRAYFAGQSGGSSDGGKVFVFGETAKSWNEV